MPHAHPVIYLAHDLRMDSAEVTYIGHGCDMRSPQKHQHQGGSDTDTGHIHRPDERNGSKPTPYVAMEQAQEPLRQGTGKCAYRAEPRIDMSSWIVLMRSNSPYKRVVKGG